MAKLAILANKLVEVALVKVAVVKVDPPLTIKFPVVVEYERLEADIKFPAPSVSCIVPEVPVASDADTVVHLVEVPVVTKYCPEVPSEPVESFKAEMVVVPSMVVPVIVALVAFKLVVFVVTKLEVEALEVEDIASNTLVDVADDVPPPSTPHSKSLVVELYANLEVVELQDERPAPEIVEIDKLERSVVLA